MAPTSYTELFVPLYAMAIDVPAREETANWRNMGYSGRMWRGGRPRLWRNFVAAVNFRVSQLVDWVVSDRSIEGKSKVTVEAWKK
jgi:hypothetical protein